MRHRHRPRPRPGLRCPLRPLLSLLLLALGILWVLRPPAPAEPALVLSGFSRQRLDALLAALKRSGVPFIAHKAMLTPTNVSWTFAQLCEELSREHQAVTGGGAAHSGQ